MERDSDLVRAVLAGRREAFAELVRRHERALLAQAGTILGDLTRAQDASQEALTIAFRRLNSLRKPEAFGAWATRIARNVALRMARRDGRIRRLTDRAELADGSSDGHLDELTRNVLRAVEQLPGKQRQVIRLKYFAGHSAKEIAQMTGQAVGTVHSQLSRAVSRLRERLKESQP